MYEKHIKEVLISRQQIAQRVKEIGAQISKDFAGEEITMVCVLRGAVIFFADLTREITVDMEMDFVSASSYGAGTDTTCEVKIVKDLSDSIKGKNVILVEDIVDSGNTLSCLKKILEAREPKCLKVCVLLDKPSRRMTEIEADYVGFEIENQYVIGYGLDFDQNYRNLGEICVLAPQMYCD